MMDSTQTGYLILADISGYTSYVAGTELEHANEILIDLLDVISGGLIPPLQLAKVEGDALFVYAADGAVPRPETLLEAIDATYVGFRDRLEAMRRRTTCECNACRAMPTLDLKFIVHHGQYLVQSLQVGKELLGSDVNLVHRLSKNSITETTGWRAYVLFSAAAAGVFGLPLDELHQQVETYEHLEPVTTYSFCLRPRYEEWLKNRRIFVEESDADMVFVRDIDAPPPIVWTWLNEPKRRGQWVHAEVKEVSKVGGRTGTGARNHCMHGKNVMKELILDWRPFEYFTMESQGQVTMIITHRLEAIAGGTRLHATFKMQSSMPGFVRRKLLGVAFRVMGVSASYDRVVRMASDEFRGVLPAGGEMAAALS